MTSEKMLRGVWIIVAGAGLALGVGSGIAAAESDSTDPGPGPSAPGSSQVSQTAPDPTPVGAKDVDAEHVSGTGAGTGGTGSTSATGVDKPTSTVSASTVTIRHDDTEDTKAAAVVDPPKPVAVTSAKHSEPTPQSEPPTVRTEAVASEPVAAAESAPVLKVAAVIDPASAAEVAPQVVASRSLAAPATFAAPLFSVRPTPGPLATIIISLLAPFGLLPNLPPAPVDVVGIPPADPVPGKSQIDGVTGVVVGSSSLSIPVGSSTYTGAADWYFPTQKDGTVQAQGVIYLQHGFLGTNFWYSALASNLAQRTNSIVVVPNVPSFPFFSCSGCSLNSPAMQQGVAELFLDPNRASLNASALAAGYHGVLPEKFVLTGHSAGGGLAAAAAGYYKSHVDPAKSDLLGVVMYDGVTSGGTLGDSLSKLAGVPVYQIAAPPQAWNANGQTTNELVALRPDQFVGDVLVDGSHVDSLIGGSRIVDFVSQLLVKRSPPGNTQAVYTLADGWINDFYAGRGPTNNPVYGTYGKPDQYVVLGQAAGVVLAPPPVVALDRYVGTWYEVGSVRQFFSIGLVNTKAEYTDNGDGTIRVVNSGNYFFNDGPQSRIVGTAVPLNAANNRLNVSFFGLPSFTPQGNYWIVDLAPDYSWAIVSDSTGLTGFLLSRTPTVSDALYQELLGRASVKGVKRWIFPTRQPAAATNLVAV